MVIQLTQDLVEKAVAISQLEILVMHWQGKSSIMEGYDRENKDRINGLHLDLHIARSDIQLLQVYFFVVQMLSCLAACCLLLNVPTS